MRDDNKIIGVNLRQRSQSYLPALFFRVRLAERDLENILPEYQQHKK